LGGVVVSGFAVVDEIALPSADVFEAMGNTGKVGNSLVIASFQSQLTELLLPSVDFADCVLPAFAKPTLPQSAQIEPPPSHPQCKFPKWGANQMSFTFNTCPAGI